MIKWSWSLICYVINVIVRTSRQYYILHSLTFYSTKNYVSNSIIVSQILIYLFIFLIFYLDFYVKNVFICFLMSNDTDILEYWYDYNSLLYKIGD